MKKTLRLILGDQLNQKHSWFEQVDDQVLFVMMEVRSETDYVVHHIQKVANLVAFAEGKIFMLMLVLVTQDGQPMVNQMISIHIHIFPWISELQ